MSRILSPDESRAWQKKLGDKDVGARPLVFERAQEANAPFQVSVTNGQVPGGKSLVIQLIKRPDIDPARAVLIAQHALVDVFGPHAGAQAELDYIDAAELKKRSGVDDKFVAETDSLSVVFGPGPITATRRPAWVRDQLATALRRWHEASADW